MTGNSQERWLSGVGSGSNFARAHPPIPPQRVCRQLAATRGSTARARSKFATKTQGQRRQEVRDGRA